MISPARKRYRSAFVGLVAALAISFVTAGCSKTVDDSGHSPSAHGSPVETAGSTYPTLDVDKARDKAKAVSSQIYDMIGIDKGKATERGPAVSLCDEDPEHLYKTRHPWSVYGVTEDELKAGFQRLREELPKRGWKIVDDGPANSEAKSPSLTADLEKGRFSVNAVLMVSTPSNPEEKEPLLAVTVVSGCWRAPEGTDLGTQY
ncbi:hypothetical protein QWJ26_00845 [Streptomyces sp. CSDS2]|uniref:hypothetical protein n=1 Tax=Streptomyces sp. CSDS2 TaxID=3055051 RepID=UPI0025AF47F3|nr:hypothetical protein [Streptomyces sp. CSDS2]MDN3258380.1 hypothetical protein [Streptomyces sp. CSDS2]